MATVTKPRRIGSTGGGVAIWVWRLWDVPGRIADGQAWREWLMLEPADLLLIAALALVVWGNWDIVSKWLKWPKSWIAKFKGRRKGAVLCEDQAAVFAATMDYDSVLSDPQVKKVWIAAIVAGRLGRMKDVEIKKVEKLVLAKTATSFFMHLYKARGDESRTGYAVELGNESAKRAKANGTAVVYHEHPMIQCFVVFRHDHQDWLRWELVLPSVKPEQWPSVLVTRSEDAAIFTRLADAFVRHHEAGVDYDDY